jgi:hypothetical protein
VSPAVKYTLGRIGLFLAVLLALWPVQLNILIKLMLAIVFSAALAFFLLRGWRDEMAQQMAEAVERRRTEKQRLRSALAGEEQPDQAAPQDDDSTRAANPPAEPEDRPPTR